MFKWRPSFRWPARVALIVVGIIGFPALALFADESEPKFDASAARKKEPAVLHGRVTNEAGEALSGARVRVAVPETDMRFVDLRKEHRLVETKTGNDGRYRLEIPDIVRPTTISIDAAQPEYRRLNGTLMSGHVTTRKTGPGFVAEADISLTPAIYFKGTVVDEQGKPIPGVAISANANSAGGSGGVERTISQADGSFELFNYSAERFLVQGAIANGAVSFDHPDYLESGLADIYTVPERERKSLRVVLRSGRTVAGRVIDATGKPVPQVLVKAALPDNWSRKATLTDDQGRFRIRGLARGVQTLSVQAWKIQQSSSQVLIVIGDQTDLEVRLKAAPIAPGVESHTLLGMKLTDLTPKTQDAYGLWWSRGSGALILDPGRDSERFKAGELRAGNWFWEVGETQVNNVREFVERVLREADGQDPDKTTVRVVYGFSDVDGDGNNTQYLHLTPDDIVELKEVLKRLQAKP